MDPTKPILGINTFKKIFMGIRTMNLPQEQLSQLDHSPPQATNIVDSSSNNNLRRSPTHSLKYIIFKKVKIPIIVPSI